MSAAPHAELRGVVKRFGAIVALDDVDLAIERGSIHGLVGENGAGKSTLGKIVAGVYRADDGELWVDGRHTSYASPRDALSDGVTLIAQEPTLVPRRAVVENVFLGIERGWAGIVDGRALRQRWEQLVEEVGFDLPPDAPAGSLRVADQQKVEVMRAVARDARLIVMDEPTAALTADEGERLFETVRRLRQRGTTIIYVSHFLAEVLALADTVTVLRDGRLVRTAAAPDETPHTLVDAMLGRSMELTFPDKRFPPEESPVVLSVRGLTRAPVVSETSFDVRAGEILGLAGLIGSGRSEVVRAIFGADRPQAGEVTLAGRRIRIRSPRGAVRAGIAMVPEDRKAQGLLMLRSIAENVTLPHMSAVTRAGVIEDRRERRGAAELMKRLDVRAKRPSVKVGTLSGGNQQKVLFGKWLFRRPRVFIADEPTRGVDVGAKRAIYELIHSLAEQGMAVILISSEHEEVLGLAHRVLVMRAGRVVAELDRNTMSEQAIMKAAFATESERGDKVSG
jgi:ABC-type sugar transport system ATPase subunit